MLMGAISCSSDPCAQSSGCGIMSSLSSGNGAPCDKSAASNSAAPDCASGTHQVGTGASASCVADGAGSK
jgi:hypothetical protein